MTIKEKMLNAYHCIKQDHIPLGIYSRYLPRGSAERKIRNSGIGIIDYFPSISLMAPPWHLLPGFLSKVKNTEFEVKYSMVNGRLQQKRSFYTPVGTISQITEEDDAGVGSEHIIKNYIASPEDYKIMQYVIENTIFSDNNALFKKRSSYLGDDGVVLCRLDRCGYQKLLIELAGPERFFVDLSEIPETVEELIQAIDERGEEQFDMVLNLGHTLIWQPDNVTADMTPPRKFKKFVQPLYERRIKKVSKDTAYIVHMDGKIKALSNSLSNCNNMIIESFSLPEIGGDIPLESVSKILPGLRIFPNVPSNWTILDARKIEENCIKLKTKLQKVNYPLMLQVSEDIPEFSYTKILPILAKVFND